MNTFDVSGPGSRSCSSRGEARNRPVKVLIVDDSAVDRRIAGLIVERVGGMTAVSTSDGAEALRLIEREAPDAVLTDLQMPGIDGLELVKLIRDDRPELPVILMTAFGSEEIAMLALQAGATSYVRKRTMANDLVPTLKKVLFISETAASRKRLLGTLEHQESSFILENDPNLIAPMVDCFRSSFLGSESATPPLVCGSASRFTRHSRTPCTMETFRSVRTCARTTNNISSTLLPSAVTKNPIDAVAFACSLDSTPSKLGS